MIGLNGQAVLVTGASRGAGAGIARALAGAGARVIVHYARNREAAETVAGALGQQCLGLVEGDFAEPDTPERVWGEARALAGGQLDRLALNHGIFEPASIEDPLEAWRANWMRTLQVDLISAADLARLAARDWLDQSPGGAMVAITSRAAQRGDDPDHPAYAAAKAGLTATMKTLARAYAGRGVLAYSIAPGWIDTEMAPRGEARKLAEAEIPLGRMAGVDEIGALAAFLLSGSCESAAGSVFDVNGASHVR